MHACTHAFGVTFFPLPPRAHVLEPPVSSNEVTANQGRDGRGKKKEKKSVRAGRLLPKTARPLITRPKSGTFFSFLGHVLEERAVSVICPRRKRVKRPSKFIRSPERTANIWYRPHGALFGGNLRGRKEDEEEVRKGLCKSASLYK